MKQKERFHFYYEDRRTGSVTEFDIVAYSLLQACFFAHKYQDDVLGRRAYFVCGPIWSTPAPASMSIGIHGEDDYRNYKMEECGNGKDD